MRDRSRDRATNGGRGGRAPRKSAIASSCLRRSAGVRPSSAEATAESLRPLGADDTRTFCLRQGSDGPDAYPANALVVVDFRFLGHSQSALIADRAERSGAQYVGVRSGKGSLARVVAAALEGRQENGA